MRKLTVLMIGVLLVAVLAGTALAEMKPGSGAGKVLLFESQDYSCQDGASDTSGRPFGFAVMNTNRTGELIVQVSLKRAEPNTTYDIWVNQVAEGVTDITECALSVATATDALRTNRMGNGNAMVKVPRIDGAVRFWVSATSDTQTLRSRAVTLD
jgi:hypothetical protein